MAAPCGVSLLFIRDVALIINLSIFTYQSYVYIYTNISIYHRNGPVYLVHGLRGEEALGLYKYQVPVALQAGRPCTGAPKQLAYATH